MHLTVSANYRGVDSLFARTERAFADMAVGPMGRGFEQAGESYLGFARRRFLREGNGEWKPLAPATQKERKRLGFPPAHPILFRLGILATGLVRGLQGNVFAQDVDGVDVGYGGDFQHPGYTAPSGKKVGGNVRLAKIARFHNDGTSKMTARKIIVSPDAETKQHIRLILNAAVTETLQQVHKAF